MKEENRLNFYGTLDSLIAEYPDYTPCGTCRP
jgi:hypothetical protein